MSNNDYIIDIKNVTKKYGTNIVLNDVTVSFEKGKIHGLVGRNGSGKTMLMKCICGFVTPSSGEILINGIKVDRNSKALDNIGAIIENPGFLGNYSAYNNLKFLAAINKKAGKDKIRETIKLVGLDPDNKKHVGKYSLGMKQRLGLAQALMEDPDILLLDEPTNGLDVKNIAKLTALLRELQLPMLIASHDLRFSETLADSCLSLATDNDG